MSSALRAASQLAGVAMLGRSSEVFVMTTSPLFLDVLRLIED
jgi:hypothetical protein